ncbi:hypothetical protein RF11_13282 [Thelohanellus kitauei]|uniref:Uncharacterized protein n=1 Tax=Thelohanellus kitauei TaxID=669202 RepID=A0A0C2MIN1_THEKT|nr:hypothetical protein RF11_13282 [Thelohanellus kitauei]
MVAENQLKDLRRARTCYKLSADGYHQILSCSAYKSYRKYVEVLLEQRFFEYAIIQCVEIGYIIEKEFDDVMKSKEFYDLADDIGRINNYKHVCQLTPEYMKIFCDRISVLNDDLRIPDIKYHILFTITNQEIKFLKEINICRKCVCLSTIHSKYIHEIGLQPPLYEKFDKNRDKVDFVKTNHEKYIKEVEMASAEYNKFIDESKKNVTGAKLMTEAYL